jgi:ribosomal-protein-alanine N-acetyltransferase
MRSKSTHPSFPPLETERLRLRDFRANDAAFVLRLWSEPVVTEYMIVDPPITTLAQAALNVRAFRRRRRSFHRWVLVLKETGEAIGTCGFTEWRVRYRRAEIGFDLLPSQWGKGLMGEALAAVLRFGFEELGLHRIWAMTHPENARSIRVLERAGFKREGHLRDYYIDKERFVDRLIYALLEGDWR